MVRPYLGAKVRLKCAQHALFPQGPKGQLSCLASEILKSAYPAYNRDANCGYIRQPYQMTRKVITYGTFDTLHYGHIFLLKRARELGDHLTVALSSDAFNALKGKESHFNYAERYALLAAITYVDEIIPEDDWDQKRSDVQAHGIDVFTMGDDWTGKFDFLTDLCEVIYLSRTPRISSTAIKTIQAGA